MKAIKDTGLTQARAKELLDYDPVSGVFRWKAGNGRRVRAGDIAGVRDAWGYLKITIDDVPVPAHRVAWLYVYGETPTVPVKHRNGVNDDNRIANLYTVPKPEAGNTPLLTASRVRELFDYDAISGVLIWKVATSSRNPKGSVAGTIAKTGYRMITVDWQKYLAHRLIWMWHNGTMPERDIDHINGDRSDNRISNLRSANRSENMSNVGRRSDNSSGYKGVGWHAQDRKWRAYIQKDGKFIHLGLFDTPEAAHEAYKEGAKRFHGKFAKPS